MLQDDGFEVLIADVIEPHRTAEVWHAYSLQIIKYSGSF